MTGFKWLNLELYDDEFGDGHWKLIEGELSIAVLASPFPASIFAGQYVLPEYWVAKHNGRMRVIGERKKVARLLIPVVLGS